MESGTSWKMKVKSDLKLGVMKGRKKKKSEVICRRCNEHETLPRVLGFCPQGELLRIDRHNTVRSIIANRLREHGEYEVPEEVQSLSTEGSTRRADIIIIDRDKKTGLILDPTVRFEINEDQRKQVHEEKRAFIFHAVMISVINIIFKIGMSLDLCLVREEQFPNLHWRSSEN
ncbi:hypothetical protein ANN_08342 [Periplaneta americana]|uniref:Uncharacterized protein n=1 Tax=Periplaneta americana TaxID=6978 RepID=A0ABQ8T156_PERAM|nr:hypothetical protein ANN_08342 [Periplaneta americana]